VYQTEGIYSKEAFDAWRRSPQDELSDFRRTAAQVHAGSFWDVANWEELRSAVSFLTLMNKRSVLYFRGQSSHFEACLPTLFRNDWSLDGQRHPLSAANRAEYYAAIRKLQPHVYGVAAHIGTPRHYLLEQVPVAAAAILQHYELWPTYLTDLTRSLPIALCFASRGSAAEFGYLYVFAMPDLRGSITSDMDQHMTICRLEAVCPPDAIRPHHQDAYLVARFPEPQGNCAPGDKVWDYWARRADLMRRLVAKFRLRFSAGRLAGAPGVERDFLLPPLEQDRFGLLLEEQVKPVARQLAAALDA
jgi:hypothetical protein